MMTRQEAIKATLSGKVNEAGLIQGPCKFEGEPPVVVALWDLSLRGCDDDVIYDGDTAVSIFVVDDDMRREFPETEGFHAIAVWERSDGFVCSEFYDTKADLEAAIARCEETVSDE